MFQETKCSEQKLQVFINQCWKNDKFIDLGAKGSAGGLEIIWDPNLLHMEGFFSSQNTLSGLLKINGTTQEGVVSNVSGPHQIEKKNSLFSIT